MLTKETTIYMIEESVNNKPIVQNIEHVSGDSFNRTWSDIVDADGLPLDLSAGSFLMMVRKSFRYDPIITIPNDDFEGVAGEVSCSVESFDADPAGRYKYQLQHTFEGEIKTIAEGEFLITHDLAMI